MPSIQFNCGEFLPGKEPITGGIIINTVPSVVIPKKPPRPRIPAIPEPPEERRWACVSDELPCPIIRTPGPNGDILELRALRTAINPNGLEAIRRRCIECVRDVRGAWVPTLVFGGIPAPCNYTELNQCQNGRGTPCRNSLFPCEYPQVPPSQVPPTTTPTGGPGTAGPGDFGPGGPGTGGPATQAGKRWKCQETKIYCPMPPATTKILLRIERNCVECTSRDLLGFNSYNLPIWSNECVYGSVQNCRDGRTVSNRIVSPSCRNFVLQENPCPAVTTSIPGPEEPTEPPIVTSGGPAITKPSGPLGPIISGPTEPIVPDPKRGPTTGGRGPYGELILDDGPIPRKWSCSINRIPCPNNQSIIQRIEKIPVECIGTRNTAGVVSYSTTAPGAGPCTYASEADARTDNCVTVPITGNPCGFPVKAPPSTQLPNPTGPEEPLVTPPSPRGPTITKTFGPLGPIIGPIEPLVPDPKRGPTTGGGGPYIPTEPDPTLTSRYRCNITINYCPIDNRYGYNVAQGPGTPKRILSEIRTPVECRPTGMQNGMPIFSPADTQICLYATLENARLGISLNGTQIMRCVTPVITENCYVPPPPNTQTGTVVINPPNEPGISEIPSSEQEPGSNIPDAGGTIIRNVPDIPANEGGMEPGAIGSNGPGTIILNTPNVPDAPANEGGMEPGAIGSNGPGSIYDPGTVRNVVLGNVGEILNEITGGGGGGNNNGSLNPGRPRELRTTNPTFNYNTRLIENDLDSVVMVNTQASLASIASQIPAKTPKIINVRKPILLDQASPSATNTTYSNPGLFDPVYTFFNPPTNHNTELVRNDKYPKLFNALISSEIKYFIDKSNTPAAWDEYAFANLTLNKIALSLSPQLLYAFNNIHDIGGNPVDLEFFLTMVQKLIVTGRLNELDSDYYISLADKQSDDRIIKYSQTGDTDENRRAALGLISYGASSSDPKYQVSKYMKNQTKRQRRLNTDIEAKVDVFQISSTQLIQDDVTTTGLSLNPDSLYLDDPGIKVYTLDSSSNLNDNYVSLGDGFGYYFSALDYEGNQFPLVTDNELSASFFIPPDLRHNTLNLLGIDSGMVLTVSSIPDEHEFKATYNSAEDVGVMYFALDLSTVGDGAFSNSLVNSVTATYVLLSNDEAIEHSKNYSLNTTKVNVDFRDPFIHYSRDSGKIEFEHKDITFRSYAANRTMVGQGILTRNLPFALILTPGCGSKHNPFDGQSNLVAYGSEIVVRSLALTPDTDIAPWEPKRTPLDETNIKDAKGVYYHGIYERDNDQDPQGMLYTFNPSGEVFANSYYIDGTYTSEQPASSLRTPSYESQLVVGVVDKLLNLYNVEEYLTWWDVYRRLNINQIGGLMFTPNTTLINKLANGWRGVPIIDVLSRVDKEVTGIKEDLDPTDIPIINEEDRPNA